MIDSALRAASRPASAAIHEVNGQAGQHRLANDSLPPTPRVAVLTPVYQHAHFLGAMLESLRIQTFVAWECAIVLDGPDADAERVAREASDADARVQVRVLPSHAGLPIARNTAAAMTTAEWLLPFDADDLMDQDYLATLWALAEVHEREGSPDKTRAYFTPARLLYDDGRTETYVYPRYDRGKIADTVFLPGSSLFRREPFERLGGLDPAWDIGATDWMFWIRLAAEGRLAPVQAPAAKWTYRQHAGFRAHQEGVRQFARLRPEMRRALRGRRHYGDPIP